VHKNVLDVDLANQLNRSLLISSYRDNTAAADEIGNV